MSNHRQDAAASGFVPHGFEPRVQNAQTGPLQLFCGEVGEARAIPSARIGC